MLAFLLSLAALIGGYFIYGASLPEIVGWELGNGIKQVMRVFAIVLLLVLGAVFVVTTSGLIAVLTPEALDATFWAVCIKDLEA